MDDGRTGSDPAWFRAAVCDGRRLDGQAPACEHPPPDCPHRPPRQNVLTRFQSRFPGAEATIGRALSLESRTTGWYNNSENPVLRYGSSQKQGSIVTFGNTNRNLAVEKTYFVNDQSKTRTYYLNGTAVEEGAWSPVRIACTTSNSGNRLVTINLQTGRYAGTLAPATEFAQN